MKSGGFSVLSRRSVLRLQMSSSEYSLHQPAMDEEEERVVGDAMRDEKQGNEPSDSSALLYLRPTCKAYTYRAPTSVTVRHASIPLQPLDFLQSHLALSGCSRRLQVHGRIVCCVRASNWWTEGRFQSRVWGRRCMCLLSGWKEDLKRSERKIRVEGSAYGRRLEVLLLYGL